MNFRRSRPILTSMNGRPSVRFLPLLVLFVAVAAATPAPDKPSSGLRFGRCALGAAVDCLDALKRGIPPEDRASVVLLPSGVVAVEPAHASASANFEALKKIANGKDAVRVSVLAPEDRYSLRTIASWPAQDLKTMSTPMGHPDTKDGFLGYTFPQFRGRVEDGIMYSPGAWTEVVVNAKQTQSGVAESIHHEFRHALLGDFGRSATLAKHGRPDVERETKAAEDEARLNAAR